MKMVKLSRLARVIRSKNSGPFELTLDIIFPDQTTFDMVSRTGVINKELIARLYGITVDKVLGVVEFSPALAIKATIVRPIASGDLGERDVYGAQQHAPLLDIEVPIEEKCS